MLLRILVLIILISFSSFADKVDLGMDIDVATKALAKHGYEDNGGLAMVAIEGFKLKFFNLGGNTLILRYSEKTRKLVSMSYHLSTDAPKATQKTFDLEVKSFDLKAKELRIKLK